MASSADLQSKVLAPETKKSQVAKILVKESGESVTSAVTSSLLSDSNTHPGIFLRNCLQACRIRHDDEQMIRKLGKIRKAILTKVLHLLMTNDYLSSKMASLAVDHLVEDLDDSQLPTEVALKLFGMCRGQIRESGPDLNTRWFPALRQVIVNLSCRDKVVYDDHEDDDDVMAAEMTGQEFRLKALRDLCAIDWRSRHSAAFCALFRELDESSRLRPEEKSLLVTRLSSALRRLPPQEVPPLAHQMLEFSRDAGSSSLLLNDLAFYFNSKMDQIREGRNVDQDSQESADMIGREEGECERSLLQAEGTVMFHLAHAARIGHPIYKDILKLLRQAGQSPEVVLGGQFQLFLVLSLSSLQSYHQVVVDGMKGVISKCIVISQRRRRDGWFRGVTESNTCLDAAQALCSLVQRVNLHQGWDLVGGGITDLAFTLLDIRPPLGGKPDAKIRELWSVGRQVLVGTFKSCSASIKTVLPMLGKRIKSSQAAPQFTDCLKSVVRQSLSLCMENAALLGDLVARLQTLGLPGAKRTISALLPLIKVNRGLRDATIVTLNKSLFDRSDQVKQIGICGLLQLMKIFKITTALPVTQLSQSSGSLTQMSISVYRGSTSSAPAASSVNVTLCSEMVGAVRRGLTQSVPVRQALYSGLHDVVARNPVLCCDVIAALYEHAQDMGWTTLRSREMCGGLIDVDTVIEDRDNSAIVKDSLGWFFNCAQQLVTKSEELYANKDDEDDCSEEDFSSRDKMSELLEELVKRYSDADFVDLGFEKEADFTRGSAEGDRNAYRAELVRSLLEALMDYTIMHGADVDEVKARRLIGLYKRYEEVSSLLKNKSGGPVKKAATGGRGRKKKVDADDTIQQEKQKIKSVNAFVIPERACTLRSMTMMLKTLTSNASARSEEALAIIKTECPDFVLYLARTVSAMAAQTDAALTESGGVDDLSYELWLKHAKVAAKLCLDMVASEGWKDNLSQYRESASLECVEALLQMLNIISNHFPDKLDGFMTKLVEDTSSNISLTGLPQSLGRLSEAVIEHISTIQERIRDNDGDDADKEKICSKIVGSFVSILSFVAMKLDCGQPEDATVMKKISDWCRDFGESKHIEVLSPFVDLFFASNRALKESSNVSHEIASQLRYKVGDVDSKKVDAVDTFKFINMQTSETVLRALKSHTDGVLDSAETLIMWCKQRQARHNKEDEAILRKCELDASLLLGRSVHTAKELAKTNFRVECILDHVVPVLTRLYTTMATLAKYFCTRSKQSRDCVVLAKFDHLINLVGKELSRVAYLLITHVQAAQDEMTAIHEQSTQGGKRGKSFGAQIRSQVLKESKGIPNLIFRIEAFENEALRLGTICKMDLLEKTKLSKARDFRLKKEQLRQLDQSNDENDDPSATEHAAESTLNGNDDEAGSDGDRNLHLSQPSQRASTTMNSVLHSQRNSQKSSQSIPSPPPSKKMKVKMNFSKSKGRKQ